jgi:hypothetical protein
MKMNIKNAALTRSCFGALVALGLSCVSGSVLANPRPLPFTYPYETLPEGSLELELYTDVVPLRVEADATDPTRGRLWEPMYQLQSEIEYGISDRWEVGFYQVFEANPQAGGSNQFQFDGLKGRVRTRLAEAGEWPVDVSLYFELEAMHDEMALEEKVNLERTFGDLKWMANLWVEESLSRPFDSTAQGNAVHFIVNPTTGFTYQVTPLFHPGVEYWARGELSPSGTTDQERNNSRVHHFVGPALHLNFGKLWWSLGVYAHLNDLDTPQPGDAYGPVWFRSVLGLEL